ncbi:hypothetical protein LPJ74_004280 [Coemansia sp. RSA 1843]|nr:hypothetical protein LPJ74_004280 [Coemansia sp. RSA 1843]
MSQSDWETDSDYRQFNPGMFAMRQLGRSVSRRTKRLLQPVRNRQDDGQEAKVLEDEPHLGTGANSATGNGYFVYDFDKGINNTGIANEDGSSDAKPYWRGPPQPSGIHRRSLSFDNLVVLPDSIPRRSTEPAVGTTPTPHNIGLPESSTWNSGNTMTRTAAASTAAQSLHAASLRPDHVYDATRRKWVPEFAYSPRQPPNVDSSNDGTRLSLSAQWRTGGVLQANAPHGRNGRHRKSSASRHPHHNRESFSGPAQLDASANFSESHSSAVNISDQFQDHHPPMWRDEEAANTEAHRGPEVLAAMAEIAAAAANAGTTPPRGMAFIRQSSAQAPAQTRTTTTEVLPSMPVSLGLFRRQSARSQNRASRESSQRKVGNFARVIGNISRRLNRIRSNRSASQPATPAEVRHSILESARQNMLNAPNGTAGLGFYRFVVNPADPVSDADSLEPDSPTISHHPSSARPSGHQRSTSFPPNGVGSARYPFDMADNDETDQAQHTNGVGIAKPVPGHAISNMHNTTAVNINEIDGHDTQDEFIQLESIPASQDATFSAVHSDTTRRTAIFHSGPAHRRVSSDSAWLRQTQGRGSPLMTNQGHDGSLSAIVQAKLDSKFIDSVHVSTRLNSNSNTDSSYGTFVRFHNSGELNGIFTTDHDSHQPARDNTDGKQRDHQTATGTYPMDSGRASLPDGRLQTQLSVDHISGQQQQAERNGGGDTSLNGITGAGSAQELPGAPGQAEAVFISNRRARNQENIRQFVDEMRAAREDSVRRRRDAEMRHKVIRNDQAVLDATVYVYERQQKKDAHDRQRIEQMQQLLEEEQLDYLKEKLSERIKQQQQQQQRQIPQELETGASSSSTIGSGVGGGGCAPPMVPAILGGRSRLKNRRKSEGSGHREAVVKEGGRRRATMFGMFCVSGDGSSSSASIAAPLPKRLVRKDAGSSSPFGRVEETRKALQLDKELPPLPIAYRRNGLFQAESVAAEQDQRSERAAPRESESSPLRRSRSFSHFGSGERIAALANREMSDATKDPWSHRADHAFNRRNVAFVDGRSTGMNAAAGVDPSQQEEAPVVPDTKEDVKEGRMSRAGALLGVLGMFGGNHARRKSSSHHDAALRKNQRHNGDRSGNRRNMALYRGQRRHTFDVSEPEADVESDGAGLSTRKPAGADKPAPNVRVNVPKESLSNEIYAGFVHSATDDAQSSSRRRMYSHILTTLQGSDAEPLELEPAPMHNRSLRVGANAGVTKPRVSAGSGDDGSNGKAGEQLQTFADDHQGDADRWRDSAITGVLTQVSAATSPKHESAAAEATGVLDEQAPARANGPEPSIGDYNQRIESSGDDDYLIRPRRYKHVVRFEEVAGPKARTSSLALDTITARTESGELYMQRAKHRRKSMARSTPHSHSASQVVSSDGSFADMIASANAEAYQFHLADLPGLEGVDTPSTNDAMLSPGLSTPRHLPASERLRRLENEIFNSGRQSRPTTSDSDRANLGRPSADVPFDSPISDAGTGRTQILDFAEANIHTGVGTGPGPKYRRPSARPEIRDVRGIVWDDTNPTTTATESVDVPGESIGLAGDKDAFAGSSMEKKSPANRSVLGNGTTDTLQTLGNPTSHEPAAAAADNDGDDGDDNAPLAAAISSPKFAAVSAEDSDSPGANDATASGFSQPSDPAHLARLVQTSPDPRKLIYDASSQFGTMRSPRSLGFAAPDAKSVGESSEGHRELLADIAARLAKHNGGVAMQKPQLPGDIASSAEFPEVTKSQSAPSATLSPRNISAENRHMHTIDGRRARTSNSRSSLGFNAASGDDHMLRHDSDLLATTADSDAVGHASNQAIKSFEPMAASTADASAGINGAAGGLKSSQDARADQPKQDIDNANVGSSAKLGDHSLAFQEYVEQQRKLPRDRSSHAGVEQLNFRVSLLDRPMPEYNRRSRSVSLPAPQRAGSILASEVWQQRRPSVQQNTDTAVHAPRPFVHQRANSFYDSPPLVQALLKPDVPSATPTTHSKSQGADEEIAERALFSHLLGDGAALTSPDLKLARRQSTASSLAPAAPQLFDPAHDTGENGVPDSVLRAYLAGDIMAIERFFEHIMRITAPSSVYDGEASEDGDWTYGLEGPPPGFAAKKTAAKKEASNTSREVPGMVDTSATASHAIDSSCNLQQQATAGSSPRQAPPDPSQHPASVQDDCDAAAVDVLSVSREHVGPDTSYSANNVSGTHSNPSSPLMGSNASGAGLVLQINASHQDEAPSARGAGAVNATEGAPADSPRRKIAIPRSRLSKTRRSSGSVNEGTTHGSDANIGVANHRSVHASAVEILDDAPLRAWDDPSNLVSSGISERGVGAPCNPAVEDLLPAEIPASYAENAQCLSPARLPAQNHSRGQSGTSQRKPIPVDGTRSKKHEKQLLLTRLRVLEGMIQKSAIEESRLQPPPALHKPQLVMDMESLASIYSSSMELDYDRINMELSRSVRNSTDKRQSAATAGMFARPLPLSKANGASPQEIPEADHAAAVQSPSSNEGGQRAEVLKRLRHNSQSRARAHYRTSVVNRQTFVSPGQSTEGIPNKAQYTKKWHGKPIGVGAASRTAHAEAKSAAVPNASVLSEVSDAAYSARSSGSIRIEIVDESPFAGSRGSDMASMQYRQHALPLPSTGRFRRSAKYLI